MSAHGVSRGTIHAPPTVGLRRAARTALVWCIFAGLALATCYPLIFLTFTSLRTSSDYLDAPAAVPREWTLDNVVTAFTDAQIGRFAINSLIVVVAAVILLVVVSSLASYALTQFEFRLRGVTLVALAALMAVPVPLLMVPMFRIVLEVGLLNTRLGLVLVYTALSLPFNIYLLASYMRAVPREVIHAATIDGAGVMRIFWSVVLPLVRPGIVTLATLDFLFLWNELLFSLLILQEESTRTIMVGITQFRGQYSSPGIGVISSALLLSALPPLLIFVFFNRSLTRGLTAGANK